MDISKTEIVYDTKFDNPDFEAINALLIKAFGGSDRDINATKKAFNNSRHFAFAYIDKALVGCARAVSDKNNQALILNVAVDPEYQGSGAILLMLKYLHENFLRLGVKRILLNPQLEDNSKAVTLFDQYDTTLYMRRRAYKKSI